jgi:hypothetical protein
VGAGQADGRHRECKGGVATGALRIAPFFLETIAQGDLTRIRHRPTWANGRLAVTIETRAEDGTWNPHGISVLEIEEAQIIRIDAFATPSARDP